jgi:hypothetical protein
MKPGTKMLIGAHLGFLLLIAIAFLPPLSKEWPGEFSRLTVTPVTTETGKRLHFDRGYDFPAGTMPLDVPVWPLHAILLLGSAGFLLAGLRADRRASRHQRAMEDQFRDY